MVDKMISSIEEKYGKPFSHWIDLLRKSRLEKHGQMLNLLKKEHGFTHGFANLVAHKARESDSGSLSEKVDLVQVQYSKSKKALRPIYNKLIKEIESFGKDIEIAPKNAYVSLRRNKQFGLIQPSTKTRIDVGINLKGKEATERLETSGSFNAMVSHRVRINDLTQVDQQLLDWLKEAYDRS